SRLEDLMLKSCVRLTAASALLLGIALAAAPVFADSETVDTLGGAAIGGLVGSQFGKGGGNVAATVGGVVAGGLIGNAIGRDQDAYRYYNTPDYGQPAYAAAPPPPAYYTSPPPVVYEAPPPVYVAPPPPVVYYPSPWHHYRYYYAPY